MSPAATAIHGSNLHSSETQASVHRRATFDVYEPPRPQPQPRRASTRQDLRRVSVLSRINSRVPTISDLRHTLSAQMQPSKRLRNPPGFWRGVRSIITTSCMPPSLFSSSFVCQLPCCSSGLNILLVFIPISVRSLGVSAEAIIDTIDSGRHILLYHIQTPTIP